MPRVAIFEQVVNSRSGFSWPGTNTVGDAVNDHYFIWSPRKVLTVRNVSGGSVDIAFLPQSTNLDVFTAPSKVVTIPNGVQRMFGPFPSYYSHPEDGDRVWVNVDGAINMGIYDIGKG